jgi:hypothetical protein
MRSFPLLIASVCALGIASVSAVAATPWPARVGRISLADSGATLQPVGGEWADAAVNEPVAAGTSIRSGNQGRVEFHLSGAAVTLAPGTTVDIVRLDDAAVQLALPTGHVDLAVEGRNAASLQIDTAQGPVHLDGPGRYGIDAGNGLVGKLAAPDAAALPDQVPAAMPGAAALAANGDWERSEIGAIWYPKNLPAGWTPFRDGSWRYLQPWGWTWIDAAPWGFAPSHYGRWARIGDRWGWVPGSGDAVTRFVPATVAFLGTPGIGLSYAGGFGPAVAWFPLAPGETYWPPDKGDAPVTLATGAYKYRRFASAVPRAVFVNGKPVVTALVDIPERRLDVVPVIPGSPQLAPPAPKLVAALPPIRPAKPAPPPLVAIAAPKPAPTRIALDVPARRHAKHVAIVRHPHAPPVKVAAAPPHPDHGRRQIAEAHHILRQ